MSLLQDVLQWSDGQPPWVQDALRRIFATHQLSAADYDELLALLLAAHGVAVDNGPTPVPLEAQHLPAIPTAGTTNVTGIEGMRHVNRFPMDSAISFSPDGLTIVYGENGSGKSGVARVLKQVCRARKRDKVLGNAYAADFSTQDPSALIRYQHDGRDLQSAWSMANTPPEGLQSVSVFDSACSVDYISAPGDASFQPFGLGQLEALAGTVFPEISRRVDAAIQMLDCDVARFANLATVTTTAGALVSNITADTAVDELQRLGTLTPAETVRFNELATILSDTNAEPKALALDGLATRLATLHSAAILARAYVTDAAIDKWRGVVEDNDTAREHRRQAEALLQGDFLPGTGSDIWRSMFLSAKAFSLQEAYRGHEAPNVDEGAKCVLCQTELDDAARHRMTAFNDFVIGGAATTAQAAATNLTQALALIEQADLSIEVDEILHREINETAPEIITILADARSTFDLRRKWMLQQQQSRSWSGLPPLAHEPGALMTLETVAAALKKQARTYRQSVDQEQRQTLLTEHAELSARGALAPHVAVIAGVISNLKQRQVLRRCKDSLDTTAISRRIGQMAALYITDALTADMVEELKGLGVTRIAHGLRKRVDRGRTLMTLTLNGADAKAASVLSEGEQGVASLALFFAELHQSGSRSGLIVDDPVSSLDHKFRYRVATRLVHESTTRQVIVLTHDPVFLSAMLTQCEKSGIAPSVMTIAWADDAPGHVMSGLPWMNMSVGERLQRLKADQAKMVELWGDNPSEDAQREMAAIYARMRGTLERVVREAIFNKAIRPFDDRVQIERVAAVAGFSDAEFDQLNEVYLHCNPTMDGHDSSGEGLRPMLNPADLATDIATLEQLVANANQRRRARERQDDVTRQATKREG